MLGVANKLIMLSVIMLSVIMHKVMAPNNILTYSQKNFAFSLGASNIKPFCKQDRFIITHNFVHCTKMVKLTKIASKFITKFLCEDQLLL